MNHFFYRNKSVYVMNYIYLKQEFFFNWTRFFPCDIWFRAENVLGDRLGCAVMKTMFTNRTRNGYLRNIHLTLCNIICYNCIIFFIQIDMYLWSILYSFRTRVVKLFEMNTLFSVWFDPGWNVCGYRLGYSVVKTMITIQKFEENKSGHF